MKSRCRQALAFSENRRSAAIFCFYRHRLCGAHELRQQYAPDGRHLFSAPAKRGARTAQACSSLTGGVFFAEPQRGDSPRPAAGTLPRPAAGAKRKGHLRFPFLFGLLPFPCFLIRRRFPICDRSEIRGTAVGLPQRVFRNLFAVSGTVLLHM